MGMRPKILVAVLWMLAAVLFVLPAFAGEEEPAVISAAEEELPAETGSSSTGAEDTVKTAADTEKKETAPDVEKTEETADEAKSKEEGAADTKGTEKTAAAEIKAGSEEDKEKEAVSGPEEEQTAASGSDNEKKDPTQKSGEELPHDAEAPETEEKTAEKDADETGEQGSGNAVVRTGVTAGMSWKEMENGDIVMEDGTVYSPVYPSEETVRKRLEEEEKAAASASRQQNRIVLKAAKARLAAERPSEVPESFSGAATVTWRDNGSESSLFGLSGFSGIPEEASGDTDVVYVHCADATAAAPYEGMVCSYTAELESWDGSTGTATYSVYATPPGATDGVSRNEFGLIGYQHLAGELTLSFPVNGTVTLVKTAGDTPVGNGYYSYEGVTYGLYSDEACTVEEARLSCDTETGVSNTVTIPQGTYYLKETMAGKGLKTDPAVTEITVVSGEEKQVPVTDEPVLTKVNVQKVSADTGMTSGNSCYAFSGAQYGVFRSEQDAEAKQNAVAVITVGPDGYGESAEVLFINETYYICEMQSPENGSYRMDTTVYPVQTKESVSRQDAVRSTEIPEADVQRLSIRKTAASGISDKDGKTLAGTRFTIRYYKGYYDNAESLPKPERTWVLQVKQQTDSSFRTYLHPDYKVSGDDFYYLTGSTEPVLPLGTITIEETAPAEGYQADNTFTNGSEKIEGTVLAAVRKNGSSVELQYGSEKLAEGGFTASDTPVYGGVKIRKMDAERPGEEPQGDAQFTNAVFEIVSNNAYAVSIKGKTYRQNEVVMTIKADETGQAATGNRDLQYGSYTIREAEKGAPAGYQHKGTLARTFSIKEDGMVVDMTDPDSSILNLVIRGGVSVVKQDAELKKEEPVGAASLAGIQFSVSNAGKRSVLVEGKEYKPDEEILTLVTDSGGRAETAADLLPYGTYRIRELPADERKLSANDTYLWSEKEPKLFTIRENGVVVTAAADGEELIFSDQVKRNDLTLRKTEDASDRPMGSIPFLIEHTATGEKHVIVTDGNGLYSSSRYAHSFHTNENDALLEGYTADTVLRQEDLSARAGTWFGLGQEGSMAEPDDSLPAFPYGKYTVTELRCEANEGYDLIRNYPFIVEEDSIETGGEKIELNNLHNIPSVPEIRTMALSDKTGTHVLDAEKQAAVTDIVSAVNLQKGKTYALTAVLMDADTENALRLPDEEGNREKVTGETVFSAVSADMEIHVPISLDASSLAGKTLVVYETLFLMEEDGDRIPVAEHKELTDRDQTLTVPEEEKPAPEPAIRTTAADQATGDHTARISEKETFIDTIVYEGLEAGKTYTARAVLMNADTGKEIRINSRNIRAEKAFTPERPEGTVQVKMSVNTKKIAGVNTVVFEEVYEKNETGEERLVAEHKDLSDTDQQVRIPVIPEEIATPTPSPTPVPEASPTVTPAPEASPTVTPVPEVTQTVTPVPTAAPTPAGQKKEPVRQTVPGIPKTGDTGHALFYVLLMAGAAGAVCAFLAAKKKRKL